MALDRLTPATRDMHRRLSDPVPVWDSRDPRSFPQLSVDNLYHALCHSRVHGSPGEQSAGRC